MQNLPNITPVEVVTVGSAMLVLCVAPAVLAWSDARRRRKALSVALARAAAVPPQPAAPPELGNEPLPMVVADGLAAATAVPPAAAVFEVPTETAVPAMVSEPATALVAENEPSPVAPDADQPRYQFCLQELRRVRLPDWPPADVRNDPVRGAVWREAERLAEHRQREITAMPLSSPQRAQSSCLGSAEADDACVRLHFLLFPVLWPSTEEQAAAEAVFEIDRTSDAIRGWVNSLRRAG
jgi:hypothetical protein